MVVKEMYNLRERYTRMSQELSRESGQLSSSKLISYSYLEVGCSIGWEVSPGYKNSPLLSKLPGMRAFLRRGDTLLARCAVACHLVQPTNREDRAVSFGCEKPGSMVGRSRALASQSFERCDLRLPLTMLGKWIYSI